jgi:hypothetical protein
MATIAEKIAATKKCCHESISRRAKKSREFFNKMFDGSWKVFVIRRDESTGEFVGKKVCCADCPV